MTTTVYISEKNMPHFKIAIKDIKKTFGHFSITYTDEPSNRESVRRVRLTTKGPVHSTEAAARALFYLGVQFGIMQKPGREAR